MDRASCRTRIKPASIASFLCCEYVVIKLPSIWDCLLGLPRTSVAFCWHAMIRYHRIIFSWRKRVGAPTATRCLDFDRHVHPFIDHLARYSTMLPSDAA